MTMLENFTIKSLLDAYASKKVSKEEVFNAYLDRIEKYNQTYNVYVNFDRETSMQNFKDMQFQDGQILHGIPYGLKDNFIHKNNFVTASSKLLEGFKPSFDSEVVSKLKKSGAVSLGMVNTDEFTCGASSETSIYGPTLNPYDTTCVSGGSSGGSAALVPLDFGVFAMGTDTGGSIRQPASFCNAVGLKVSYGRVSRSGVLSMASSLDSIGHLTKTVYDAALVLNATAGLSKEDSTTFANQIEDYTKFCGEDISGVRIGVPVEYMDETVDSEVKEKIQAAIKVLESKGAIIKEVSLPMTKYGVAVYYIVNPSEVSTNMERYDSIRYGRRSEIEPKELLDIYLDSRSEGFGIEMKRRILVGSMVLSAESYESYYLKAQKVRTLIINDFNKVFEEVDVLVGPVCPIPPFKVGEKSQDPVTMYTVDALLTPSALAGLCGISVPAGFNSNGLPIGLQIIAPHGCEDRLFKVGHKFEQETEYYKQTPDLI